MDSIFIRIERLWRDVRTCVTSKYYNVLRSLEQDQLLDVSSTGWNQNHS